MKPLLSFVLLTSIAFPALAGDLTQAPVTEDGACEFRAAIWTAGFMQVNRVRTIQEAEAAAIRLARERCKNGMVLLLTDHTSGAPATTVSAMNVASALCKAQDIERTTRPAFGSYFHTDIRCSISKIAAPAPETTSPPPPLSNVPKSP